MNGFKTFFLMLILTLIFVWLGNLVAGPQGAVIAFILAAGMNLFSYFLSDKIALASYKAQPIQEKDSPQLHSIVSSLAQSAGIPKPRVYLIPTNALNAFATGRNPKNAAVAVTKGLLDNLSKDELAGVIAHEMAHVKNRDILISTIVATLAGAIMMLRYLGMFLGGDDRKGVSSLILWIVAPLAAMLIQLAISRSREYSADATGAKIAGSPMGLANALRKLESFGKRIPMQASPNTAHMFIASPFLGGLASLLSTHPPMAERIKRLETLARGNLIS
jgi:heat shock protein HtpX